MSTIENPPHAGPVRGLLSRLMTRVTGSAVQEEPRPDWWRTAVVYGRDHEGKDTVIPTATFFTRFKATS